MWGKRSKQIDPRTTHVSVQYMEHTVNNYTSEKFRYKLYHFMPLRKTKEKIIAETGEKDVSKNCPLIVLIRY